MLNILFMGTPDFAKESLEKLYNSNHNIIGVVTNPDRPKGRGMKMIVSPVKEFALDKNLEIYQPEKVKQNIEFINQIKTLNPDIICVVAYGKILPKEILEIPKLGCINLHGSLLPQYRGAAPIQWSVINGDKITGVTTIYMNETMDAGDMILKKEVQIGEEETTGQLWERLSKIGADLLLETIDKIEKGTATRVKQEGEYTIAPMLDKQMANIDWENKTAKQIKDLVRGLNPIMGAYSYYEGKKIKFWKVKINEDINVGKDIKNGTILVSDDKKGLFIKTKDGVIEVEEIQGENAKRMNICDFLRGNTIQEGSMFTFE